MAASASRCRFFCAFGCGEKCRGDEYNSASDDDRMERSDRACRIVVEPEGLYFREKRRIYASFTGLGSLMAKKSGFLFTEWLWLTTALQIVKGGSFSLKSWICSVAELAVMLPVTGGGLGLDIGEKDDEPCRVVGDWTSRWWPLRLSILDQKETFFRAQGDGIHGWQSPSGAGAFSSGGRIVVLVTLNLCHISDDRVSVENDNAT